VLFQLSQFAAAMIQRDIANLFKNQAVIENRTKEEEVSFPYSIVTDVNGDYPPITIQNIH
jgi:hypothetical protein